MLNSSHGRFDLLDFFRGTYSWRKLIRLMSQLDSDSCYAKAQADDPAAAEAMIKRLEEIGDDAEAAEKWKPAVLDWNLDREQRAVIIDWLGALTQIAAELPTGVKSRHPAPTRFPRPESKQEQARKLWLERRDAAYIDRMNDVIGRAQARWREKTERGEDPYGEGAATLTLVRDE